MIRASATSERTRIQSFQGMASSNGEAQNDDAPSVQQARADDEVTAEELARAPETFNMSDAEELSAANSKDDSEGGKIKALLNVLRRMIGVKDLAAIRLSLPANLLEPVPNLEYWNYMDRADLFSIVGDLDDPQDRMLATLRFMFCKELKFVHGKVCKPYNSILGEHFRCHWTVQPPELSDKAGVLPRMALRTDQPSALPLASSQAPISSSQRNTAKQRRAAAASSSKNASIDEGHERSASGNTGSVSKSSSIGGSGTAPLSPMNSAESSSKTRRGLSRLLTAARSSTTKSSANSTVSSDSTSTTGKSPALSAQVPDNDVDDSTTGGDGAARSEDGDEYGTPGSPNGSFKTSKSEFDGRKVAFLTEQVSHHPPISSFFVDCKDSGVQLFGVDQLSAKFTGTNVKIFPGEQNQGVFLRLTDAARCGAEGEEYQITHPTASINGLLRGTLWVSIQNTTHIVCRGGKRSGDDKGKRLCALTEYKDESWLMKAKYAVEGVVFEYDERSDDPLQYKSVKDVPSDSVVITYEGSWKGQVTWKLKGERESKLLIDLNELDPIKTLNVRPLSAQDEMESRKIWNDVTEAIVSKDFSTATKNKQAIEQTQREKAADRKRKGESFTPRFFDANIDDGRPKLSEAGRAALDGELAMEGYGGR